MMEGSGGRLAAAAPSAAGRARQLYNKGGPNLVYLGSRVENVSEREAEVASKKMFERSVTHGGGDARQARGKRFDLCPDLPPPALSGPPRPRPPLRIHRRRPPPRRPPQLALRGWDEGDMGMGSEILFKGARGNEADRREWQRENEKERDQDRVAP